MIAGEMLLFASFLSPSFGELALIGIIALLLYGSDLPQVIRSWGKTYAEFRGHLNGVRNDLNDAIYAEPEPARRLQYYPEFQNDASNAGDAATDESSHADASEVAASDEKVRHDTHGAA
ncbi:MAG TPA: twin-arginine translocase TatA/TatE family subunit [Lacipirellula sp.]